MVHFNGGVLLPNSFPELRHLRYNHPVDKLPSEGSFNNYDSNAYNYVGPIYHDFGHTLAEFVHRIIPSRQLKNGLPNLFIATVNSPKKFLDYPDYILEIYKFLGVNELNSTIVSTPTTVKSLTMTSQGSNLGWGPSEEYLKMLGEYSIPKLNEIYEGESRWDLVYVSRSSYRLGSYLGESYVEKFLENQGYYIFKPENFSFSFQMDVYRKADKIIFTEGSACHGVELLGRNIGECTYINRRASHNEIFKRVLSPRASKFNSLNNNYFLGSLQINNGNLIERCGITLFHEESLKCLLKNSFNLINLKCYIDAAEFDLQQYIDMFSDKLTDELEVIAKKMVFDFKVLVNKLINSC